jgi:TolB-like protein
MQAIGRGLADLMITDLRKKRDLTIVERDHIQALLDEIALGQSDRVDVTTAARSGRLLQAGRVVQGNVAIGAQNTLTINEQVVNVATSVPTAAPVSSGTLDGLFDLEKRTVLSVIDGLGFQLTAAERNAIQVKPTQNVQAFLAYSRGLVAQDAGRLDEATSFFDNARALDPHFGAATQHAADAHAALQGAGITTATIEGKLRTGSEGQIVAAAERGGTTGGSGGDATSSASLGATLSSTLSDVNPSLGDAIGRLATTVSSRDASTSTTVQDQTTTRIGTVIIVIKRP